VNDDEHIHVGSPVVERPANVPDSRWLDVMMRACPQRRIAGLSSFSVNVDQLRLQLEFCDLVGRPNADGLQTLGPDITAALAELYSPAHAGGSCPAPV